MPVIKIPYTPRLIWRDVIHPALKDKRFAVLVCHRRFGKTIGSINELIKKAVQNKLLMPQYAYIAPYLKQAKLIAWKWLLYYTNPIPGRKVNKSELFVELPSMYSGSPGARIYIIGSDHPDALRGIYLDGVIIDEYAQIKQGVYGEVVRPALADRKGFAYFIGTPKGQNQFYELYQKGKTNENYFTCLYRYDETGILDDDEVEMMRAEMTEAEFRQELLCDFSASATNTVMTIDKVTDAAKRAITERDVAGSPIILGVDVARFGDDRTVIQARQGLWADKQIVYKDMDTMAVASAVVGAMERYNPDMVFVDVGGIGAGVVDRLRQLGYTNIVEINFGASAINKDRFANLRAEMYFKVADWITSGAIPDDSELKSELTIVEYKFTASGKIILVPKDKIKELMGASPDKADALAITFAMPVIAKELLARRSSYQTEDEYDPFDGM